MNHKKLFFLLWFVRAMRLDIMTNKVDGENIYLNIENKEINIPINNIKKSRIVFDKFKEKVKG